MDNIPVYEQCDVLVVGGGPAGCAAAAMAARAGASTLLVEKNGFLGGNLTAAGIDTIYGIYTVGENSVKIIGGFYDEVYDLLTAQKACYKRENTYGAGTGLTFSVENMKIVLENLVLNSRAKLYYHTISPQVWTENGVLKGCIIANRSGLFKVAAKIIIDTTGDADIIAGAGGSVEKAIESGKVQSSTAVFFMANVDTQKAKAFGKSAMWEAMRNASQNGEFVLPRLEGSFHATPNKGMIEANMTRISDLDTTDFAAVSKAESLGRAQVQQYAGFLKKYVPGFEEAYLVQSGSQLGMREGRRVIGDYILTKGDVLEGKKFEDTITRCGQPIEDHHEDKDTRWVYIDENGYYDIPYRCLIPQKLSNVLTAGRCLSATHDGHASARSSGTAFSMGQAAGLAAVMALGSGDDVRRINVKELQGKLKISEQFCKGDSYGLYTDRSGKNRT